MIPFILLLRASAFTIGQKCKYVRHVWQSSVSRGGFPLIPNSCRGIVCITLYRALTIDSKHRNHPQCLLLPMIILLPAKSLSACIAPQVLHFSAHNVLPRIDREGRKATSCFRKHSGRPEYKDIRDKQWDIVFS